MNQYLKNIQDLIEGSNELSENAKESLSKALSDADKQWDIIEFKSRIEVFGSGSVGYPPKIVLDGAGLGDSRIYGHAIGDPLGPHGFCGGPDGVEVLQGQTYGVDGEMGPEQSAPGSGQTPEAPRVGRRAGRARAGGDARGRRPPGPTAGPRARPASRASRCRALRTA